MLVATPCRRVGCRAGRSSYNLQKVVESESVKLVVSEIEMGKSNNRMLLGAMGVVAVCATVAVVVLCRQEKDSPKQAPVTVAAGFVGADVASKPADALPDEVVAKISPQVKKEIDELKQSLSVLEKQMSELEKRVSESINSSLDARKTEETKSGPQSMKNEIAEIRKAIDSRVESHPLVIAKRAEYAKLDAARSAVVSSQASMVSSNFSKRVSYAGDRAKELNDLFEKMQKEVNSVLASKYGKQMGDKLSKQEQATFDEIYAKYGAEIGAVKERQKKFDDDFVKGQEKYGEAFNELSAKIKSVEKSQEAVQKEISLARKKAIAEDPEITRLNSSLIAKTHELQSTVDSGSGFNTAVGEVNRLSSAYSDLEAEAIALRDTIKKLEQELQSATRPANAKLQKVL